MDGSVFGQTAENAKDSGTTGWFESDRRREILPVGGGILLTSEAGCNHHDSPMRSHHVK
jgi:hypothetical protein